jgi:hypothetical protein
MLEAYSIRFLVLTAQNFTKIALIGSIVGGALIAALGINVLTSASLQGSHRIALLFSRILTRATGTTP